MITPRGFGRLFRLPATAARAAEDVDEELRFHLDMRTRELVAGGMTEAEAEADTRHQPLVPTPELAPSPSQNGSFI